MQIIISPAKSLDFETPIECSSQSEFRLTQEAQTIANELKNYSAIELEKLMKISSSLAELNHLRFQHWQYPFDTKAIRQAIFAFKGDVYQGFDVHSLNTNELERTQNQLRILSGLYGLLRPLDMIMPYRLEMGTSVSINGDKDLYGFWGNKITELLIADIQEGNHKALINLASNEYYKAINKKQIPVPIITPAFKDLKNGQYKIISFYAKKARGLMTRFIIQNQISNPDDLKAFDLNGYYYNNELSTELNPVFTRDQE